MKLYRCNKLTCKWFNSFLTERALELSSEVPQGSIVLPIIFTIYLADLKEWVRHSKMLNNADDMSKSHSGHDLDTVVKRDQMG